MAYLAHRHIYSFRLNICWMFDAYVFSLVPPFDAVEIIVGPPPVLVFRILV